MYYTRERISGASGGEVRISCSGEPKAPGTASTIAEEAVDQLQENEKLVAGKEGRHMSSRPITIAYVRVRVKLRPQN